MQDGDQGKKNPSWPIIVTKADASVSRASPGDGQQWGESSCNSFEAEKAEEKLVTQAAWARDLRT